VQDTILTVGYTADKETRINQIYKITSDNASISDDSCYSALFEKCLVSIKAKKPDL